MNNLNELKSKLNKRFEILDATFDKYGIELLSKGVKLSDTDLNILLEGVVKDKTNIPESGIYININLYNADNELLDVEQEYFEQESLDDMIFVLTSHVYGLKKQISSWDEIFKIRIYVTKAG